jgi:hypothetical protein
MRTTLGLIGDLDDVELLQDVERAFDVRLPDGELTRCTTVGDIFELVVSQLPEGFTTADRCASTMCFYRVRRVILTFDPGIELRPSTPIEALRRFSIRRLYRAFERDAGLTPPSACLSGWGITFLLLALALPVGLSASAQPWWSAAVAAAIAVCLYRLSPVRLPPGISTVGDLVDHMAARNLAVLAADGARLRPAEAWTAFRKVCAGHAVGEDGEIGANTLIYAAR